MKKLSKTILSFALTLLCFAPNLFSEEWNLVFADEFDGTEIKKENWSFQNWEPGTVNAELQKYTDSPKNVYVKNGYLTIQALKGEKNEHYKYTSGRLISFGKKEFCYGRFESRLKVPSGKGFLPAFWLMGNESIYGQWPRCGEIDIMEVMGHDTKTLYTTTHFGSDIVKDSKQGQKVYSGAEDFAKDFHVFACEWEPGEIRFYVDGKLIHTENKWYSARSFNGKNYPYPAPFNKPMYIILNLAVGGSWVGNPDSSVQFAENARLVIDYVRVYERKGGYKEMEASCKEPVAKYSPKRSEAGNIIHNGDFSASESFANDGIEWCYLQTQGGQGNASIKDGAICIETKSAGSVDYSIQLVQGEIPLEKGHTYTYSFDAWSDKPRKMTTAFKEIEAWTAYIQKEVQLTKKKKHFEYKFTVTGDSNDNARLEYNMGAFGSTATIHIDNVQLIKN